ncbi:MAG: hypothetical protein HGGPFJEG_00274 [Ignavibacteria bacterium]|nr:hypothetical protein [Ignavibacteria bacterium]
MIFKKIYVSVIIVILISNALLAQDKTEITDNNYKFRITFPAGWQQRKVEETDKKDAISYSFDLKSGKMAVMLIAFKVDEVKNLTDLIYTLEKDLTLNIPKKDGEYSDFDSGNFDGRYAKYKDTEFTEVIYYYRTKLTDAQNFTYLLRFIVPTTYFSSKVEEDIKSIANTFSLITE